MPSLECYVEGGLADGIQQGSCPDNKVCMASGACEDVQGTYSCKMGYFQLMPRIIKESFAKVIIINQSECFCRLY